MVVLTNRVEQRLTMQVLEIAPDTTALRSLDWDRDRFDIEFGLQNGTTYNSFLIRGEKTALVDTSHAKFRQLYLETLTATLAPVTLDYLIISHTEPDHSGLVPEVLALAPQVTVVGSKVAIQFLEDLVHQPFSAGWSKMGIAWISAAGMSWNFSWPPTSTGPTLYLAMMWALKFCLPVMPLGCTTAVRLRLIRI